MGQNTATSKIEKNVMVNEIQTALVQLYQYLNSGNLRANGLKAGKHGIIMTVGIRVHAQKIIFLILKRGISNRCVTIHGERLIIFPHILFTLHNSDSTLSSKIFKQAFSSPIFFCVASR